jgi:hypothetical protein
MEFFHKFGFKVHFERRRGWGGTYIIAKKIVCIISRETLSLHNTTTELVNDLEYLLSIVWKMTTANDK